MKPETTERKAQHTPGPWSCRCDRIFGQHNVPVADVIFSDGGEETGEQVANALLIAAAPDLLTACVSALALIDADYRGLGRDDDWILGRDGGRIYPYDLLTAAIAKARGEASDGT